MAEIKIKADSGGGSVSLKGPASSGATPSWRLPSADGSTGQFMKTDGSGVLSFATVDTSIADDSIVEAKLDIHAAPSGTDKFLGYTSNGMEWAVPSGGSATLISRTAVTSGSTHLIDVEDTSLFDGTYEKIRIGYYGVRLATDNGNFNAFFKYGGSYQTSSHYNYHSRTMKDNSDAIVGSWSSYNNNNSQFLYIKELGNAAGENACLDLTIWNPASTSLYKMVHWECIYGQQEGRLALNRGGGFYHNTSTGQGALQGVRLSTSTDQGATNNATDYILYKWGWKKS